MRGPLKATVSMSVTSRRKNKKIVAIVVVIIIAASVAGYFWTVAKPTGPTKDAIKIGFTLSFSGSASYVAEDELRGITLWANSTNAQGGVFVKALNKKVPVKLVYYDDQSKPDIATSLYEKLINEDKVDLLLGTSVSLTTSPAATVAAKANMFFLAPQAANPTIYRQNYTCVFGTMPLVDQFTGPVWPFLKAMKMNKVAILYDKSIDLWVSAHANDLITIQKNGLELVFDQGFVNDTENFVPLLLQAQSSGADALIVEDYMVPNVINIVKQMMSSGVSFKVFFNAYVGANYNQLMSSLGDLGGYAFGSTQGLPSLKYPVNYGMDSATFLAEMRKSHGSTYTPGAFAYTEYVSGLIVQKVLETANSLRTEDLVAATFALSGNLKTLIGTTVFEKTSTGIEQRGNSFVIVQVQPKTGGGWEMQIMYPTDVKTADPMFTEQ